MPPTTIVHRGLSSEEDYGLHAVAQHNAAASTRAERFSLHKENSTSFNFCSHDDTVYGGSSYLHSPPTPCSYTASEGIRTRSGRSTRSRTDSPFRNNNSGVSKPPLPSNKKNKRSCKNDKSKTPRLMAPLSVLTKDIGIPLKDIEAWVNRPAEVRRKEAEKRNGYVTRPMNSFMLYRSAYADRTKQLCLQNNHQVVSSWSGESWPMEAQEVRDQFNYWAKIERANHQAAHPEYKFSPSKPTKKKRKGQVLDGEEEGSELEADPDVEYQGRTGRSAKQRRQVDQRNDAATPVSSFTNNVGFNSRPYFTQQETESNASNYLYASPAPSMPSNCIPDSNMTQYSSCTNNSVEPAAHWHPEYISYIQEVYGACASSSHSQTSAQHSLGGYGVPGTGVSCEPLSVNSRTGTPVQAYNNQYDETDHLHQHSFTPHLAYHPQQYPQQVYQPQTAIDPRLNTMTLERGVDATTIATTVGAQGELLFDGMLESMNDMGGLLGLSECYEEETSLDQTLAGRWDFTGELP